MSAHQYPWPYTKSVLGSIAFLWWGVVRRRVRFARLSGWRALTGGLLRVYALLIYPVLL
jgi:hypothetical protein